ncbi:uncharacterized protein LOC143195444 [Rhynchophorus ferrugineus]|uniref:uncharacterized protein LOC143195444 n=1 Tax=Rhynchophorus ferrugineus TaxID=354439 RepID=UPI003FCE98F6
MKKYQRLLLTLTSVASVSLFLVYRHQYNRLHHVLEVFNFFGTPCNITELQRSEGVRLEYDWGPLNVWKDVDSKWYIYNAFLSHHNNIQGITVRSNSKVWPKTCFLMYEDEVKYRTGKLYAEKFLEDKHSDLAAFIYTCNFSNHVDKPYMIAFKAQSHSKFSSVLVTRNIGNKIVLNTTICVLVNNYSKKALLEFLSFHNILGVNSFIIYYEQNIPYKLIKILKNFSDNLNIWLNFLPWNLPFLVPDNFTTFLLEKDCEFRTKGHAKYSILLSLNEYVMPYGDSAISKSLDLPIKELCLNHINKNRPIILQNFESVDNHKFSEVKRVYRSRSKTHMEYNSESSIFDKSCVIYRYEKCPKGAKTTSDYSMRTFSTDLTRSTLVQLLINDDV